MKRHEEIQLINEHIARHGVYRARMGECLLGDNGITPRMATAAWAKYGRRGGKKNVSRKERPKCANCGAPCPRNKSKYCSKKCYHAVHVQAKPNCRQCGEPVPRNYMKFCSMACANEARGATVYTLTCGTCGKEFERQRGKMRPAKVSYCSRECQARRAR